MGKTLRCLVIFFRLLHPSLRRISRSAVGFFCLSLLLLVSANPVQAQEKNIHIGDEVQVVTGGKSLNLRSMPGTSSQVITSLRNGERLKVIDGPESADGYHWWKVQGATGTGWAAESFLEPINSADGSSVLSDSTMQSGVDWRGNLTCAKDSKVFSAVEYCTGYGKNAIDTVDPTAKYHVLVIDLSVKGVAFEYIIPKGQSDRGPATGPLGCRDPNVPQWAGPEGGCYSGKTRGLYPAIGYIEAMDRANEILKDEGLSAQFAGLIDADYGSPSREHGPEGLLVVRGIRLDGVDRCDDDFNAVLRPWLGLGKVYDPSLGRLQVEIGRLENDHQNAPDWMYTGIGGGPWLIQDGAFVPGSEKCIGTAFLPALEHVSNCNFKESEIIKNNGIDNRQLPARETYNSGSCSAGRVHTAAGYTADGRWLFLVVAENPGSPEVIAQYMLAQLGVYQAIKFDGGGSSKLVYKGASQVFISPQPDSKERLLTNYLAVYSPSGKGIQLPLEAEPTKRVFYQVLGEGETAQISVEFQNSGHLTWLPEDGVELREEPWTVFSPQPLMKSLPFTVPPGKTATWEWEAKTSGVLVKRFQMVQNGQPFGIEAAVVIVVVPKSLENKRQEIERKIQELIDQWEQKKDAAIDQLIKEIIRYAESIIKETCFNCNHIGLVILATVTVALRKRPKKYEKSF
jgi:hypothetical protein